jgi:hypothetical protein
MSDPAVTQFVVGWQEYLLAAQLDDLRANLTGPVVVAVLILAAICFATGFLFHSAMSRRAPSALPMAADGGVPDEIVAVIAAAVAEVIDSPHRIVRIRGLMPDDLGWMLEGRMQHHASHKLPHR